MAFLVEVWSDYALFTRPEMKTERCSYDVMTASAARGILESVFWHGGLRWVIDKIYVLKPIKFTNIRRNEVSEKLRYNQAMKKAKNPATDISLITSDNIQQRAALVLKDVHYVIEAHFEMTEYANPSDNPGKFSEIMKRRLKKGQCYSQPYMGCREFPTNFALWEEGKTIQSIQVTQDLGYMLLDMDYSDKENIRSIFHRAYMNNGVIEYPDPIAWINQGGGEIVHGSQKLS